MRKVVMNAFTVLITLLYFLSIADCFVKSLNCMRAVTQNVRCIDTPTYLREWKLLPVRHHYPALSDDQSDTEQEIMDLMDKYKEIDYDDIPDDVKRRLTAAVQANAPNDFEVKMDMLGITPLTIAGFVLAAVLLICNRILGSGWAGDILGINRDELSQERLVYQRQEDEELQRRMDEYKGNTVINYDDIYNRIDDIRRLKRNQ